MNKSYPITTVLRIITIILACYKGNVFVYMELLLFFLLLICLTKHCYSIRRHA